MPVIHHNPKKPATRRQLTNTLTATMPVLESHRDALHSFEVWQRTQDQRLAALEDWRFAWGSLTWWQRLAWVVRG